ncbi:MAG: hypothetical protein ACLUR5_15550 [Eubacterium ventriosum]
MTKEILEEKGYYILMKTDLRHAMEEQREKARNARKITNYMGADATVYDADGPSYHK